MTDNGTAGPERESFASRPPAAALVPFVERYIGYRMLGFPPGIHRGLPSRHPTFIVSIGPPIEVARHTDPAQAPGRYGGVLSGFQAAPAIIRHHGDQEGVAIELSPAGFRALFAMPAAVLWNTTVDPRDVIDSAGIELWERLQGTNSWEQRFAVCDSVLSRLVSDERPDPALIRAWDLLVGAGGSLPVARLASEVGWSRQNLTRRFRSEFGFGPKLAAKVIRFERARRLIEPKAGSESIAAVAAACGYSDQAHFTRDFAELAGVTPGRFICEEEGVPKVQDAAAMAG